MADLNLATLSVEVRATGVQQAETQINNLTSSVQQAGNSTGQATGGFTSLGQTIRDNVGQTQLFGTSLNSLGSMFTSAGGMATVMQGAVIGLTTALVQMATQAISQAIEAMKEFIGNGIQMASDLQEIQNVVDVTFGNNAKEVNEWAKTSVEAFGLTELQAKKFSSTTGAIINGMGVTGKKATEMSKRVAELAGDMASFYNLEHEAAFEKIRAGIIGETEPLKALGIVMTETNLSAFALAEGMEKPYKQMSESEKVMVRYNFILEKTALAHGDFARTSDSYANSQKTLQNTIDSLGVSFGEGLLPGLGQFNTMIGDLLKSMEPLVSLIGNSLGRALQAVINFLTPIIEGFKNFLAAIEPIIIIVEALNKIVMAFFQGFYDAVWGILKPAFEYQRSLFEGLKEPILNTMQFISDALLAIPNGLIDAINWCIEGLNKLPNVAIEPIKKVELSFVESMDAMKESSEELTDGLQAEVEKLPTTWDECFEQIMALTDEKYDSLKARAEEFNNEMKWLDDEYGEYKAKLMSEEEKRLDSLYEKNGANALEIARIKALELAEYEKNIDAEIEAFRKKDEVQRTSSLDRQKALIDEQEAKKKNVELDKAVKDAWDKTDEIVKSNNKTIIQQYQDIIDKKIEASKINVGASDKVGVTTNKAYATGTAYHTGGLAWVGEFGRELVEFPRGSRVYNNRQAENIVSGSNQQVVNNYNVSMSISADSVKEIDDLMNICNNNQQNMRMG